ncbi:hypothetical protein TTHERM_00841280 (macronuclear) [Tetrahymena thermophila SB210]|uniref:Uncharacterized protein n=1 Tax=Tetrahymena thermophila (strain SB210) TaxID=312017 RepID=I7M4G6_TETTS|nr:hypothetical protein TTHERM_00841280 [Tetrahymena thermophila SB210]EAS07002.2 hypothetical protein TTHERM_00841280 [Tetrahymena thermophila SB210]|eukprot:XP_001027244.2 hypothetical protein TTHERM_00841280 [Tetrahymena thermophila SB210]
MDQKVGQKNNSLNQTYRYTQKKLNIFELQYHNRIQRIEVERRACTIQKLIQTNEQDQKPQTLNEMIVQPKLYYQQNDPTMIFETQIQFPNGFTQVLINEVKIIFSSSKGQRNQLSKNKYQSQNFDLNSKSANEKEQIFLILEDFYIDVRVDSKKCKNKSYFRYIQDDPVIESKVMFVSNALRECLIIKNIIKSHKKMITSILNIIFYEDKCFDKNLFKIISKPKKMSNNKQQFSNFDPEYQNSNLTGSSSDSNSIKTSENEVRQKSKEDERNFMGQSENIGFQINGQKIDDVTQSIQESQNNTNFVQFNEQETSQSNLFNILNDIIKQKYTIQQNKNDDQQNFQKNENILAEEQLNISQQNCKNTSQQLGTLSKKNVVKNIVKAFQRYLKSEEFKQEIETILEKHSSISYEPFLKKYLSYEKKKSYNNNLIKLLINNEDFSSVFKFFIKNRSKQMLQNSNVSDKITHFQILDKYIDAIEDPHSNGNIFSSKKVGTKKKKSKQN